MVDGWWLNVDRWRRERMSLLHARGGVFYNTTCRSEFHDRSGILRIARSLLKHDIEGLIVSGSDDSSMELRPNIDG